MKVYIPHTDRLKGIYKVGIIVIVAITTGIDEGGVQ